MLTFGRLIIKCVIAIDYTTFEKGYLLMAQMLEEVSKNFEGLYSNAFTLRGHELVDYPGIDTSSERWQQHTVLTE